MTHPMKARMRSGNRTELGPMVLTLAEDERTRGITPTCGVWDMRTKASRYILDFDAMTATRIPGPVADHSEVHVADLRKDNEAVPLLAVHHLRVGLPAVLLLDLRGDGVVTRRETTRVVTLTRVP